MDTGSTRQALNNAIERLCEEVPTELAEELTSSWQQHSCSDEKCDRIWLKFLIWMLQDEVYGQMMYVSEKHHIDVMNRSVLFFNESLNAVADDNLDSDRAVQLSSELFKFREELGSFSGDSNRLGVRYALEAAESALCTLKYPDRARWLVLNAAGTHTAVARDAALTKTVLMAYSKKLIDLIKE